MRVICLIGLIICFIVGLCTNSETWLGAGAVLSLFYWVFNFDDKLDAIISNQHFIMKKLNDEE